MYLTGLGFSTSEESGEISHCSGTVCINEGWRWRGEGGEVKFWESLIL